MAQEPTKEAGKRSVAYVSDAHLFFAGYSEKRTRITLKNLFKACEKNDVVVLNGDMFELPFSHLGFAKTVTRALAVLELTLDRFPNTQINYTIGNHDADPVFVYELKKFAQEHKNFQVTEKHLLLGHYLSSHGDLPDEHAQKHKVPFYAFFKGLTIPAQFTLNKLQGSIPRRIQEKGDKSAYRRIPLKLWGKKVAAYFAETEPEAYKEAEVLVLGHTHRHGKFKQDGKIFYNTGVMFKPENRHKKYNPITLPLDEETYQEYCQRPKETPVLEEQYADQRALDSVAKIDQHQQDYSKAVQEIIHRPGHFVKNVLRISDLIEKAPPKASR